MSTEIYEENADLQNINGIFPLLVLDSEISEDANEEVEPEEEEEEVKSNFQQNEKNPLTSSIVGEGLSLISKVSDGFAHAYVRCSLKDRDLSDVDALKQFVYLRYVDLSNNFLKSLKPLENLTTLLVLRCDSNKLTACDLPEMPFLQILSLNNNKLKSLEGLNFPLLEQLSVSENEITSMSGLDPEIMANLHTLEVRANKIKSTEGINLPNLKHLYIAANQITELKSLGNLISLQSLHLRDNSDLSSLDGLTESLTSLKNINLRSTDISSFGEIEKLGKLTAITKLTLSKTPIASEGNYRVDVLSFVKNLTKLDKEEITEDELNEAREVSRQRKEEESQEATN